MNMFGSSEAEPQTWLVSLDSGCLLFNSQSLPSASLIDSLGVFFRGERRCNVEWRLATECEPYPRRALNLFCFGLRSGKRTSASLKG
jgi:hypothetical protein